MFPPEPPAHPLLAWFTGPVLTLWGPCGVGPRGSGGAPWMFPQLHRRKRALSTAPSGSEGLVPARAPGGLRVGAGGFLFPVPDAPKIPHAGTCLDRLQPSSTQLQCSSCACYPLFDYLSRA